MATSINSQNPLSLNTLVRSNGYVTLSLLPRGPSASGSVSRSFAWLEVDDLVHVERVNNWLSMEVKRYLYFPTERTDLESGNTSDFLFKTFRITRVHAACKRKEALMTVGDLQFKNRVLRLVYSNVTDHHFPENTKNLDALEKTLQDPKKTLQKTWKLVHTLFEEMLAFPDYFVLQLKIPQAISGADFDSYFKGKFFTLKPDSKTQLVLKTLVAKQADPETLAIQAEILSSYTNAERLRACDFGGILNILEMAQQKAEENLKGTTFLRLEPGPEEETTALQYIPSSASKNETLPLVKALESAMIKNAAEGAAKIVQTLIDKKEKNPGEKI